MAQLSVDELNEGQAGDVFDTGFNDTVSPVLENRTPVKQVSTITVGAATNDTLYEILVNGIVIQFTSDASATETEIAAGLKAAADAEPFFDALVDTVDADPDVVITAKVAGTALTVTVTDAGTGDLGSPAATTANVSASLDLGFGLAAIEGATFDTITVPEATGGVFKGISRKNLSIPQENATPDATLNATGIPVYKPGDPVSLLKRGRIVVDIEGTDPVPGDAVFFRQTISNAATQALGAFTTVDDGETDAVPTGVWVEVLPNSGRAVLEINLP